MVFDEIKRLASKLEPGQVLMSRYIDLNTAMSAIQIMNPKMDMGMPVDLDSSKLNTIKEMNSRKLTEEETDGIIDELWNQTMQWIRGAPLATTVFSSVHVTWTDHLENEFLKDYIAVLLNTIFCIRQVICKAQLAEADDFEFETFGFDLATPNALERLKKHSGIIRVQFLKEMHQVAKFSSQSDFASALKHVQPAIDLIPELKSDSKIEFAFNSKLHNKKFTSIPPRVFDRWSCEKAFSAFRKMLLLLSDAFQFNGLMDDLFVSLDQWSRENVDIYTRSCIYLYILQPKIYGIYPYDKFILKSLQELNRKASNSLIFEKLAQLNDIFQVTIKILCYNWCLVRRKLDNLVLYYDMLQLEFEQQEKGTEFWVSSWIYSIKLRFLCSWLERGIELQLYATDEPIYAYLEKTFASRYQHLYNIAQKCSKSENWLIDEVGYVYSMYHYYACMNLLTSQAVNQDKEKLRFKIFSRISSPAFRNYSQEKTVKELLKEISGDKWKNSNYVTQVKECKRKVLEMWIKRV